MFLDFTIKRELRTTEPQLWLGDSYEKVRSVRMTLVQGTTYH